MQTFVEQTGYVIAQPGTFAIRVLRAFRANQGLLLAGAVAYYTLLSIVPLLILLLIALSQIIDQGELLATLGRYLEWLIPGQSKAVIGELAAANGLVLQELSEHRASLEATYMELTGDAVDYRTHDRARAPDAN